MDKPFLNTIMTDADADRWIYDRIDYERVRPRKASTHFRLERVERLLSVIGSPQKRIPAVHIAGTKGKGSTAAILDSILTCSGIRSGLFTSPHLHQFSERMRVNGRMPDRARLTSMVADLQQRLQQADPEIVEDGPTYFEVATLLGWMYFDQEQVEVAVLETGLGGRLDCTNICRPLITIITNIGLDHTHILGDTLEKIATEKAGIIKSTVPVLTWTRQPEARDVIIRRASELNCPLFVGGEDIVETSDCGNEPSPYSARSSESGSSSAFDDSPATVKSAAAAVRSHGQTFSVTTPWGSHKNLALPFSGDHQRRNAALAVAAADFMSQTEARITPESIQQGLASAKWPLRFEVMEHEGCCVILDAAHNPDSIAAFLTTLNQQTSRQQFRILIFASSQDKDAAQMLSQVCSEFDLILLTQFQKNPRAFPTAVLRTLLQTACEERNASNASAHCVPEVVECCTPQAALERALKGTTHRVNSDTTARPTEPVLNATGTPVICGTGSIFLAAELRELVAGTVT